MNIQKKFFKKMKGIKNISTEGNLSLEKQIKKLNPPILIKTKLQTNPWVRHVPSSLFSVMIDSINEDIKYFLTMQKYPPKEYQWKRNTDFFEFIHPKLLEKIRSQENFYLIFDASNEGYSTYLVPYFHSLYFCCKKYNISPKKIIFCSSNLYDQNNLNKISQELGKTEKFRIFTFTSFQHHMNSKVNDYYASKNIDNTEQKYKHIQNEFISNYVENKIFLSLSRRCRRHRIINQYLCWYNNISDYMYISQDMLTNGEANDAHAFLQNYRIRLDSEWLKKLPLTVDTDDFQINWANFINFKLSVQTLFEAVLETDIDNINNTALFYSEKTFRPIALMQPFIILGQANCNIELKNLGYELYEELFDYSFDNISNDAQRILEFNRTLVRTIDKIKNLSRIEQMNVRLSLRDKIIHNYENLIKGTDPVIIKNLFL